MNKSIIDHALDTLGGLYPIWHTASKDVGVRYAWARAAKHADLTLEEIRRGIERAETDQSKYPPSAGEFISWCKGDAGAPTKHQAWQIAAKASEINPITNPLVLEAANRTKQYDIRNRAERDVKPLFFDHYADVLREHSEGVRFELPAPQPKKELPKSEVPRERSPEDEKKFREIMEGLFDDTQS